MMKQIELLFPKNPNGSVHLENRLTDENHFFPEELNLDLLLIHEKLCGQD